VFVAFVAPRPDRVVPWFVARIVLTPLADALRSVAAW